MNSKIILEPNIAAFLWAIERTVTASVWLSANGEFYSSEYNYNDNIFINSILWTGVGEFDMVTYYGELIVTA